MILEIILGFICVVFSFVIFNLTKKCETLEDRSSFYEAYINMFGEKIDEVSRRLRDLDQRGSFSSDDEIGFFFTYVKELQKEVRLLLGKTGESEDEQSDNTVNREG